VVVRAQVIDMPDSECQWTVIFDYDRLVFEEERLEARTIVKTVRWFEAVVRNGISKIDEVSGRLSVAPKRMKLGRQKRGYGDFASWQQYARERLTDKEWMAASGGYTAAQVGDLLADRSAPVLVPTYVVTWDRFCDELTRACGKYHTGHLAPAIERLRVLGNGERR
jgi:hypothetical protein